jgi:acyl-coenzyme A thioesterase PaaI-like protein
MEPASTKPAAAIQSPCSFSSPTVSKRIRHPEHHRCIICSSSNPLNFGLEFSLESDGSVRSSFRGSSILEGCAGQLQVGIIAGLLEEIMAHCVLAFGEDRNITITRLRVSYHEPVAAEYPITLRASVDRSRRGRFQVLSAELWQQNRVKVTASGTYQKQRPARKGKTH